MYGRISYSGNADFYDRGHTLESDRRHQFRRNPVPIEKPNRRIEEMQQKLYVGNVPFSTTEDELREFIENRSGVTVNRMEFKLDRETNKPRGFAFISVQDRDTPKVLKLNGEELNGRALTINPARPKESRS